MTRDMNDKQFRDAMKRRGWRQEGFLGYWGHAAVTNPGSGSAVCMSAWNYATRREALAAFIAKGRELDAEAEQRAATKEKA